MKLGEGQPHVSASAEARGDGRSEHKNSSTLNQDLSHHDYSVEDCQVLVKTVFEALLELMIINFTSQPKKLAL